MFELYTVMCIVLLDYFELLFELLYTTKMPGILTYKVSTCHARHSRYHRHVIGQEVGITTGDIVTVVAIDWTTLVLGAHHGTVH